jgi:hypothetical protein
MWTPRWLASNAIDGRRGADHACRRSSVWKRRSMRSHGWVHGFATTAKTASRWPSWCRRRCTLSIAVASKPSRLITVIWILLLVTKFFLLCAKAVSLQKILWYHCEGGFTSASAFHWFLVLVGRARHSSPIILDISGLGRPGCFATTAAWWCWR